MRTPLRRLGAVALTAALVSGTGLSAPTAQAANAYAQDTGGWLGRQLTGGLVHNGQYDFDDYGLSVDIFFALKALGRDGTAASVLDAVDDAPGAYIGTGAESYAGATGKLASAVELQGRDPRAFGGVDLVKRLEQRIHTAADAQRGRAVDRSAYGDYSNAIGQSFAVRALAGARSPLADEATRFLLAQQCPAGFFRQGFTSTDGSYTCAGGTAQQSAPSVDATAFAVEALTVAKAAGLPGLDRALRSAARWLLSEQRPNGSFVGNGTANTNTTGLAATALALTGRPTAAERSAAWVARRSVTPAVAAASSRLRAEVGAIAYDDAALAAGRLDGIPEDQRDQWRRATAQAAIAVVAIRRPGLSVPRGYRHGGSTVTLRATGLLRGERATFTLGNRKVLRSTVSSRGIATVRAALPRTTRSYLVRVVGGTSARTGARTLKVLGPRRLHAVLGRPSVRRSGSERVAVTGLAPREQVRVVYRGHRIWSGTASARGTVQRSFRVSRSLGRQRLLVRGQFADRSVTTFVRVVR